MVPQRLRDIVEDAAVRASGCGEGAKIIALANVKSIARSMIGGLVGAGSREPSAALAGRLVDELFGDRTPVGLSGPMSRLVEVVAASPSERLDRLGPAAAAATAYAVGQTVLDEFAFEDRFSPAARHRRVAAYNGHLFAGERLFAHLQDDSGPVEPAVAGAASTRPGGRPRISWAAVDRRLLIRRPRPGDVLALEHLEGLCWPAGTETSAAELRARVERHPEGHCVLDVDGEIVGVVYSQRIQDAALLLEAEAASVSSLHAPEGRVVQLLALNVAPTRQDLGWGDLLLELALARAERRPEVLEVVGVTRCKNYQKHRSLSHEEYVRSRGAGGELLDPILRFHELHGATIAGIVPGYRPKDWRNDGDGVLVRYDLSARRSRRSRPVGAEVIGASAVPASVVEESIREVVGRPIEVSPRVALMDLGLDSLDLFALRAALGRRLGVEIDPTLFFRYPTVESLTAHLTSATSGNGQPAERLGAGSAPAGAGVAPLPRPDVDRTRPPGDAIAIIGMSCRFPGGVHSPDDFWRLLSEGRDAISGVPADRWRIEDYYDPDRERPGKMVTRCGGFVGNVDAFDAAFFNISPREAALLDPQHRMLLELAWEALEDAGVAPDRLGGRSAGVYVGLFTHDYERVVLDRTAEAALDIHFATGNSAAAAAGRISYVLGLSGPAIAVDTACSSSLTAVHLACRGLQAGDCDLALVGGASLLLSPEMSVGFSRGGMLSADGRCRAFDAAAGGYGRGEGGGVLVLKRLADARSDGDRVVAVVRGTAVNQDGASNGFTAPSGEAQRAVFRAALAAAGVAPDAISYVEAHGTGTPLGDQVELQSLRDVYAAGRVPSDPLIVGSVKTNIGHLEAAAGVAGLIKVALALRHGVLPKHLHYEHPNPLAPRDGIAVPRRNEPWPPGQKPRLAGVSSFGFSGTNAHVIVEEPPAEALPGEEGAGAPRLLTLSAKDDGALKELARRYSDHLAVHGAVRLSDACRTAQLARSHFDRRLAIVADSVADARRQLDEFAARSDAPGTKPVSSATPGGRRVAFLFTGQGSQYSEMGKVFYETQPVFRRAIERCNGAFRGVRGASLSELLFTPERGRSQLDDTENAQPALFALEYALVELWTSWGVAPGAVLGHSLGEYAGACAAGVFSVEDGMKLVAERGRLMQALPLIGEMSCVFASEAVVARAIEPYAGELTVAAINGPELVVISGHRDAVGAVTGGLAARGVRSTKLNTSHAFHSPLMRPVLDDFRRVAERVSYARPRLPVISNLTGAAAGDDMAAPDYWCAHILAPVRFSAGMESLFQLGFDTFLEIGPQSVLTAMARRNGSRPDATWLASMTRDRADQAAALRSLGQLYALGCDVDWKSFHHEGPGRRTPLPTYPFQRKRHWVEPQGRGKTIAPARRDVARTLRAMSSSGRFSAAEQELAPKLLEFLAEGGERGGVHEEAGAHGLVYQVHWRPADRSQPIDDRPWPGDLGAFVGAGTEPFPSVPPGLVEEVEAAGVAQVVHSLRELGWEFAPDRTFSIDVMAAQLGVADDRRRLLGRLLAVLAEAGFLQRTPQGWRIVRAPESLNPSSVRRRLWERHPELEAELTLLDRCGTGLSGVLRGALDPVQLIFPDGDDAVATRLYQRSPTFAPMSARLCRVVAALIKGRPAGRPVRVLEIGAGTGGTTAAVLPELPADRTQYVFTDVSSFFLNRARSRFARYPFVEYRLLDVERPPGEQGFSAGAFDLVLAANVLHATADLGRSLTHVRQLLAPGGALVALEGTTSRRWIDLIFGLLDGWWRFSDHDLRPDHPLLPAGRWEEVLTRTGYTGVRLLSDPDGERALFPQSVVLARNARGATVSGRRWLIFSDRRGLGRRLADRLRARGDHCTLVLRGDGFARAAADEYTVAPGRPEDFHALLRASGEGPTRVVHLWGLNEDPEPNAPAELAELLSRGCRSALHLVQALGSAPALKVGGLWLVTRGTQHEPGSLQAVAQSTCWGLGKVVMREHPELRCRLIDLEAAPDVREEEWLLAEFAAGDAADDYEPFVSYRDGRRYAARWRADPVADRAHGPLRLRPDAAYLVTGGLGGIGRRLSRWMVARGARRLILVGRNESPGGREELEALERDGARIEVVRADVASRGEMARVLGNLDAAGANLAGVFHCAGLVEDGLVRDLDWPAFLRTFAPKVTGSWNLHELTRQRELDFFVLFSSVFSVVGDVGLANYAAANAFLGALAAHRRSLGLPALCVDWGPWENIGMARSVGPKRQDQWTRQGIGTIPEERALGALEQLLQHGTVQSSVAALEPSTFAERVPAFLRRTFLSELVPAAAPAAAAGSPLEAVRAAPPERAREILADHVKSAVRKALGIAPGDPLDWDRGFFHLGMDSLTLTDLRSHLQSSLKRPIPQTLLFRHATVATLSDHLAREVLAPPGPNGREHGAEGLVNGASGADRADGRGACDAPDGLPADGLEAEVASALAELEKCLKDQDGQ